MNSLDIVLRSTPAILKNLANIPAPVIWANKITFRCNLRCRFCPHWRYEAVDELSTAGFKSFMKEARDMGIVINAFEGGEPLLRQDLPELMKESRRLGMMNAVITNGTLLDARKHEILPYADAVIISIDGGKETHDATRGVEGTFEKATDAARKIAPECKLIISSVINKLNVDELEDIASLGMDLNAPVSFCPAVAFSEADDLTLSREELVKSCTRLLELKAEGFRILNSKAYLNSIIRDERTVCKVADLFLTTDPAGNLIIPCSHWSGSFNALKTKTMPLKKAWISKDAKELRRRSKECCRCHIIDSRESSMILAGRFDVLMEFYKHWNTM